MTTYQAIRNTNKLNLVQALFQLALLCACLIHSPSVIAKPEPQPKRDDNFSIVVSDQVPPGFEDLAGPQTNQVDVFYQNKRLLSTIATYDFETLRFENPQLVVHQINDLIDPEIILEILSKPLPNNTDLLCLSRTSNEECGTMQPNIAGIIFDESRFRVDLFINALQLQTQEVYSTKFLPPADEQLSTIQILSLNLSGTDETEDRFNMQVDSMMAFGDARIKIQSNYTDDEDYIIDEYSIQKDNPGWEAEAGVFNTQSQSTNFFSEQDILGVRVKTSTNTRTDLEVSSGTSLFIFLSQRSRVEVFKDNRLIDARFYDAGNRQLDTSRFPDGAYQVSVRIREDNGRERTEEYFFARNAALPPMGEPQYYVEAGKINEIQQDSTLPETSENYLIHTGGSIRLKENLAVQAELANTDDESMIQLGLVHLMAGLESHFNVMATTESDWGVALRETWNTEKFVFNLDLRHISMGDSNDDSDRFDFVSNGRTQVSSAITHNLFGGRVYWRYRHNDTNDAQKSETYSLRYTRNIARNYKYQVDWDFEANKDSDDYLVGANINFRFRKDKNEFRFGPGLQASKTNNRSDNDVVGDAAWIHTVQNPLIGNLQSRLFHTRDSQVSTSGINISSESRYGNNELELNQTHNSDRDMFGYSLRSQFNMASDFRAVSLGGSEYSRSAVIIDLSGRPKGAKFEIYVDRQSAGYAQVGSKTILPLPAYDTYDIRLESRSDAFLTFAETPRQVTLYPGNVSTMTWQVDRVLVLIGRALDIEGNPITFARFQNTGTFAGTDDRGWFQVESGKVDSLLLQTKDGSQCALPLGEYDDNQDVHVFNDLTCTPVDQPNLTPVQASAKPN